MAGPSSRNMPTVVVSRRPVDGREREFERWLRRLADAAREAPGHVRADVQPPDDVHPGEWTIVYQFHDAEALHAWLRSPVRQSMIDDGDELMVGEGREQVLALADQSDSVTAFSSFRIRAGEEVRYLELYQRLIDRLSGFDGFLSSELYEPVPGVQEDTVVAFAFDTGEHLRSWLGSDERREVLTEIGEVLEQDPILNVVGGFGGWFSQPGAAEVKRWKQASIVLLALFPTSLVLTLLRNWLLPDVGLVLGVLIANVLGVIVLTWMLMPPLTRLFAEWLRR